MIIATRVVLLLFSGLFYLASMGVKEDKSRYFNLIAGTSTMILLLLSMLFM